MKGKSSSRVRAMDIMETPLNSKVEPQLSGAYIRSLVKHLSSSAKPKVQTFKDTTSPKSILEEPQPLKSPTPPPTNPKKQVRRRLHTSRPYQERLLNMAEARREIVTALKYHRASMKQANEQLQQIQSQPPPPPMNPDPIPTPNIYQPDFSYPLLPLPYPTFTSLPDMQESFNFSLTNYQPLGLNLNFQGFNNIDTSIYNGVGNKDAAQTQPLSPHSSSSSSYSFSPPPISNNVNHGGVSMDYGDANMHIAMGEKEMEEIRSIGEKHEIEWNDTMNLVNSAWWSNFLEVDSVDDGINEFNSFHEGSTYANANHMNDYYLEDASLPCLDVGEIEWSEGDWLL